MLILSNLHWRAKDYIHPSQKPSKNIAESTGPTQSLSYLDGLSSTLSTALFFHRSILPLSGGSPAFFFLAFALDSQSSTFVAGQKVAAGSFW